VNGADGTEASAGVRKQLNQRVISNSETEHQFIKHGHRQNVDNVDLRHTDNQTNFVPVTSADAVVHVEPGRRPGRLADNVTWNQGDVRPQNANRDSVYADFSEKQHSVQRNNSPPLTATGGDKCVELVDEPGRPKYSVTREDSGRYQEQIPLLREDHPQRTYVKESGKYQEQVLPLDEDQPQKTCGVTRKESGRYQEQVPLPGEDSPQRTYGVTRKEVPLPAQGRLQKSVEDTVPNSIVTGEDGVTVAAAGSRLTVIRQHGTANKGQSSVDTVVETDAAMPVSHSKTSDARRHESINGSLYHMQPSAASYISTGEVIVNTQGTRECTDSAAALPVFDSHEGRTSDAQRHKSINRSLYRMQPSEASYISTGEVVINTQGTRECTDSAAALPVFDVREDKTSDAWKRENINSSLYRMQPSAASYISTGEVVINTQGTRDIDTVAGSAAAMLVDNNAYEGKISDARRHKSADRSLQHLQSSSTASISHGEIIVGDENTLDLSETEGQSLVESDAVDSSHSKAISQPAINPGNDSYSVFSPTPLLFYRAAWNADTV